jgi:hypothetical protein
MTRCGFNFIHKSSPISPDKIMVAWHYRIYQIRQIRHQNLIKSKSFFTKTASVRRESQKQGFVRVQRWPRRLKIMLRNGSFVFEEEKNYVGNCV